MASKEFASTGNMRIPMFTQLIGAITNIILDPFFIFGIGAFPRLGTKGAAIATVIGQVVAMVFSLSMLIFKKQDVHLLEKGFRPSPKFMWRILRVGLPSMLTSALPSFTIILVNHFIKALPYAISVLGVYFKLQSFVFMPVFGLTQGLLPIMGYNYGARNRKRLLSALKNGALIALIVMIAGMLAFQLLPEQLIGIFNPTAEMVAIGVPALRIISCCFVFAALGIVSSTLFQAMGHGTYSLIISLMRQLLVLVPCAWLLAKVTGSVTAVWWSFPIAETISLGASIAFFTSLYKKEISRLDQAADAAQLPDD